MVIKECYPAGCPDGRFVKLFKGVASAAQSLFGRKNELDLDESPLLPLFRPAGAHLCVDFFRLIALAKETRRISYADFKARLIVYNYSID